MAEFPTYQQPEFAPEPQPSGPVPARDAHHADRAPAVIGGETLRTVMGTRRAEGAWTVPAHLTVTAILGTVILDFTQATFTSPTVMIDMRCFLGDLTIHLPHGVSATNNASLSMSDAKIKLPSPQNPALPRLVITGSMVMGTLKIEGPRVTLLDRIRGRF